MQPDTASLQNDYVIIKLLMNSCAHELVQISIKDKDPHCAAKNKT